MKDLIGIIIQLIYFMIIFVFFKVMADTNHIIGIGINIGITILICLISIFFINLIFKKYNLNDAKQIRVNLKQAISNSYIISSIISIIFAMIIYTCFDSILRNTSLSNGIINYTVFIAKIWFISSPFWGLELTIFKYFNFLNYTKKILKIILVKLLVWIIVGACFYLKYKVNCLIFAKPITDFIFLVYYTKICFDLTVKA